MGKVLKVDVSGTPGSDAFLEKALTLTPPFYMSYRWAITQGTLDALDAVGGDENTAVGLNFSGNGGDGVIAADFGSVGTWRALGDFDPAYGVGVGKIITGDTWYLIEGAYDGTTITWKVDGTVVGSYAIAPANVDTPIQFGATFEQHSAGEEIYYLDDLKIGSTLGGSDIFADDFAAGSPTGWDSTTGATLSVVDDPGFPGAGAIVPYVLPLRYHWRFVVVDIPSFAVLTFLDGLASGRYVHRLLDQSWEMGCAVPSDNPEVNIVHDDGLPFVEEGVRFLLGFRREGGSPPWKVRAATILLQTQDRVENDVPYTDLTGFDSWMYLNARPVVKADGSFPSKRGLSTRNAAEFADAKAATVALTLLANTITNHGSVYIDAGVAYGGTAFWTGTIETTADVDLTFAQGAMVGDAWSQLVATSELDIVLTPIYDPVNRPGYIAELSIYAQAGSDREDAIFSWDRFPRSLVDISRVKDGSKRANKIQNFSGDGAAATPQTASGSVTSYGEWWASQTYPGQGQAAVDGLSVLQLALRKRGITTVTITPAPVGTNDGTPIPIVEYDVADRGRVYASKRLRKAIAGYQRIYGLLMAISDDAVEQPTLVVSDDASA